MQSVYLIIMAGLISLLTHVVQTEAQGIPTIFAKVGQPGTEEMVSIPSGEFTMGIFPQDVVQFANHFRVHRSWFRREQPAHRVSLPQFLIGLNMGACSREQRHGAATGAGARSARA